MELLHTRLERGESLLLSHLSGGSSGKEGKGGELKRVSNLGEEGKFGGSVRSGGRISEKVVVRRGEKKRGRVGGKSWDREGAMHSSRRGSVGH